MLRKVYFEGEIGHKFGTEFDMDVDSIRDAFRCLDCNFPGVRQYLIEAADSGVGFTCKIGDSYVENEEGLLMSSNDGDMVITAIPAGAKSGGAKVLAAIAIAVVVIWSAGTAATAGGGLFGSTSAAGVTTLNAAGLAAASLAVNLALTGIQQLMAPDPSVDDDAAAESYLFNGSEQNIVEGDPVPVLYGELRVPGKPISFEILNQDFHATQNVWDSKFAPPTAPPP